MPEGHSPEQSKDLEPSSEGAGRAIILPGGRDLHLAAARRTSEETFSPEDIEFMMRGVKPNTRLALQRAWKHVLTFTGGHGFTEVPMTVETCVKLVRHAWTVTGRYGRPTSPETLNHWLWAVTKAHKVARRPDGTRGYTSPVESEEVRRAVSTYRGDWTAAGHRPDMATPIEPDELVDMVATCDARSPIGLRDALALSLMYDAGLRAGELVRNQEARPGLLFQDVELKLPRRFPIDDVDPGNPLSITGLDPQRDHLVLHIPMSKTDTEGYGDEVFLYAHPQEFAANCPVRLYLCWRKLLLSQGRQLTGNVVRQILHGGIAPRDGRPKRGKILDEGLAYDGLVRIFNRALDAAGIENPEGRRRHFALHGLRAGAAEAAAENEADTPELCRHFRWSMKSGTANRYAARGRKKKLNPARRIWAAQGGSS